MNKLLGNLFVIAAPSGAGKTSLVRALISSIPQLEISISHTTRPPRPHDTEGQDYFFVNKAQFEYMLEQQLFLEHALIYNHYYGTSCQWVADQLNQGIDVILEIDWQGAKQIRQKMPQVISIFILPPTVETLKERLQKRQQDDVNVIMHRMSGAQLEISHYAEFDYLIVNDDFQRALNDLQHIIYANRLSCTRQQVCLQSLLQQLLKKQG